MFLGIDIGTSSVKAVIIADDGHLTAEATAPLAISRPFPLWSEQDPEAWWQATIAAINKLDSGLRANVKAIGMSGQMHGATLLGTDDKPLRPAILWNDGRSATECQALQQAEPDFLRRAANLVMPGFTAPKLEWVRRHEPDVFAQIKMVLLPKDYIRFRLTGEFASDMSDSAGTLWMDVAGRCWHAPLLATCGLTEAQMPRLYEGHEATGTVTALAAGQLGLAQVPVVAGGGDNAAGALGAGALNDGDALMSLGTSGVIFAAGEVHRASPASAVHAFCHALPDRWHLMSVMLSAASCLDWACRMTGTVSVEDLLQRAEAARSDQTSVIFLPYLSGERTPHNNAQASGVLFGLNHDSDAGQVANGVLQGIAFGMADGLDALVAAGATIDALSVIGGGAQSAYWGRVLAAALNRPLIYRDGAAIGPAFGAARLARYHALGLSLSEAFAPPAITHTVEPDPDLSDRLAPNRAQFKALYTSLKPNFAEAHHA